MTSSEANHNGAAGIDMADVGNDCCNFVTNTDASHNHGNGITLAGRSGSGGFHMVVHTSANFNGGTGLEIDFDQDSVTTTTTSHNGVGTSLPCPSNVLNLTALNNPGGNLVETGGPCTNLGNNAP